jgi:allantoin racemase
MPKIMWIDPVSVANHRGDLLAELESIKRPETEVTVRGLGSGPTHLIYGTYEAMVAGPILDLVIEAEREGFDAAVIGCFYDTSLDIARELATTVQMVGPCESALAIAGSLGSTYSVIAPQPGRCVRRMEEQVARYGLSARLRSVRALGMAVADLARDKERTLQRVTDVCREVVERDGAEVCILGCTMEFGVYREVQERIGVPVIDAVVAPLKYAEMMSEATAFGWTTSRKGLYERPSAEDLADSGLAERFTAGVPTV